jgi:ATP-binding cassette, subfamily C (CFTR/MRP), member 1
MGDSVVFSRLMEEYGNTEKADEAVNPEDAAKLEAKPTDAHEKQDDKKARQALMTEEERNTGAVSLVTYTKYLKFAGGLIWAPTLIILLTLTQCAQGELIVIESSKMIY